MEKRGCQIHLSTALIIMILESVLLGLNVSIATDRILPDKNISWDEAEAYNQLTPILLGISILFSVTLLGFAAWLIERQIRRNNFGKK